MNPESQTNFRGSCYIHYIRHSRRKKNCRNPLYTGHDRRKKSCRNPKGRSSGIRFYVVVALLGSNAVSGSLSSGAIYYSAVYYGAISGAVYYSAVSGGSLSGVTATGSERDGCESCEYEN